MREKSGLLRLAACAIVLSLLCGCNTFSSVRVPTSSPDAGSESEVDSEDSEWYYGYFAGLDAGNSDGSNDGFSYGEDFAYSVDCYPVPFDDVTDPTYDNGYHQGYHNKYSTGWLKGFIEGYYSVHDEVDLEDLVRDLDSLFGPFDLE